MTRGKLGQASFLAVSLSFQYVTEKEMGGNWNSNTGAHVTFRRGQELGKETTESRVLLCGNCPEWCFGFYFPCFRKTVKNKYTWKSHGHHPIFENILKIKNIVPNSALCSIFVHNFYWFAWKFKVSKTLHPFFDVHKNKYILKIKMM